jgi:PhnB protein
MNEKTGSQLVQSYLFFNGRCEEAVEFYRKALGAQVEMIMRYKDSPDQSQTPPGFENKIMHAGFKIGESTLMASDGCAGEAPKFEGFSLSLSVATEDQARKAFTALSEGGTVKLPLTKTFWSPLFGMLDDRFGVGWMITVAHKP